MRGILLAVLVVVTLIAATAAYGGLVMVALGILHSVFPSVPAIGYRPSILVGIALSLLTAGLRRGDST